MFCFVNVKSVDRIIYSIFQRFTGMENPQPLSCLHKPRDITRKTILLTIRYAPDIVQLFSTVSY